MPDSRWRHSGPVDVATKHAKATKIEQVLSRRRVLQGVRLLEVGVRSCVIAARLGDLVGPQGEVWGIDVVDRRQEREGFRFLQVDGTELPFDDGSFDVVISNHVIEHVGGRQEQRGHLNEIRRVLRDDGWAYLATPNRWGLVEPHFKLPFLSWLPASLRSPYVRLFRRGPDYDCELLSRAKLVRLFRETRLDHEDHTFTALRVMSHVEPSKGVRSALARAPDGVLHLGRPLIPTMVFLLKRASP
jgi:SAM-dependent methyltransferase